ncbi:MAG: biopolymer transporter ExbD [Flavobacteriales bacterium]|nr:biopolymer transporter ExbD [Flavobacteriales bacterium]
MGRRELPEINAGSMADIAFLLLIFFLVTTTMDTDTGLNRRLPPPLDPEQPPPPPIKDRNVFVVLINANDQLLVEGQPMDISDLREEAKEFIANPSRKEELPAFKQVDIPLLGSRQVSKQVISLQNDRRTSYAMYIGVQNELAAAYNELREELCQTEFGDSYQLLVKNKKVGDNRAKIKAIRKAIPQRISEAEPNK